MLSSIPTKKVYMEFTLKTFLSSNNIYQLTRENHFNIQENYISAMLRENKQLVAKVYHVEFENKGLIKKLKAEKKN